MDTPVLRPAGTPLAVASTELPVQRTALATLVRERWVVAVLAAIVILAAVVRIYDIGGNPRGFFADEASFGYNAYTILHHGKDEYGATFPLLFRSFGEFKLPVFIYSDVPFIAALGMTEVAVRLTSATYGILTILTTFLLATALFRERAAGLAAAFMLAIMPWHIHFSRTGLGDLVAFPFFLTLGLYLFLLGTRQPRYYIAAGIVLGVTLYTYRAAWIVMPPLLVLLALLYHRELLKNWRLSIPAFAIIGLCGVPILLHLLSNSGDRSQQAGLLSLHHGRAETWQTFRDFYSSYFSRSFLFDLGDHGDVTRHYLPGFGELYYIQIPFLLLGFADLFWRPTRGKIIVLALLGLYPLSGALSDNSPYSSRTLLGSVVYSLITAYGLMLAVHGLEKLRRPYGRAAVAAMLIAVLAIVIAPIGAIVHSNSRPLSSNFVTYLHRYHTQYPKLASGYWGWQWGSGDIIRHFEDVQSQYDQLVMDPAFNGPEIFRKFYSPHDCEKCVIGHWDKYDPPAKQLFALSPETAWMTFDYDVKGELYYPSGALAFLFVEINGSHNTLAGMLPNAPDVTLEDLAGIPGSSLKSVTMFNEGNRNWSAGDYYTSYQNYQASIDASPSFALGFYNRGNVFAVRGQLDSALNDYVAALRNDDNIAEVHVNAGNAYFLLGQYQQAKTELDRAIELNPNIALAYVDRGSVHQALAKDQLAMADLQRALDLDPNLVLAYVRRGELEHALGNETAAMADYGRALALAPDGAETYAARGDSYLSTGQYTQAMADLNKAVGLDRDYALAYARRGITAIYIGDSDRAVADLSKAVELDRVYAAGSGRNPYWKLGDVAKLAAALEQAVGRVNDPPINARITTYINYLKQRSPS